MVNTPTTILSGAAIQACMAVACSAAAVCLPYAAWAQSKASFRPTAPVTIVVGTSPGSIEDNIARVLSVQLGKVWQSVFVENIAGAGGVIAATKVAKSQPDGRVLLVGGVNDQVLAPAFSPRPTFDPARELVPITQLARMPVVLVVRSDYPAKNLAAFIELAKGKSTALSFASPGTGSLPHLVGEHFKSVTGTKIFHVPFRGTAPAVQNLAAGSVDIAFIPSSIAVPFVREGRLRALAMTGTKGLASLPDVPLFSNAGVKDLKDIGGDYWYGLFAPDRIEKSRVESINADVRAVFNDREAISRMQALGVELQIGSPEELSKLVHAEVAKWSKVAKDSSIRRD
jgi:tripartite-type tricarboxylate transporter receptor subunit TctC